MLKHVLRQRRLLSVRSSITIRQNAAWSFPFNKRKEPENEETSSKENVPKGDIDMTLAIEKWDKRLKSAEVGNREHNLKSLLAHILGVQASSLLNWRQTTLTAQQYEEFEKLCEYRCARMPLQHILGECKFMGVTLKTAPMVFIPRPDTEDFVERIIQMYQDNNNKLMDMLEVGCGSGAITLVLLKALPFIRAIAIDCCAASTDLAKANAKLLKQRHRLSVHTHTMSEGEFLPKHLEQRVFDLIVSNPPFATTEECALLSPEVQRYENHIAVDGGPDGLRVARTVLKLSCKHLRSGGKLWLELGADQPPLLKTIVNMHFSHQLRYLNAYKDHHGRERFVEIEKI